MLPLREITIEGKALKKDTKRFLESTLLALLNELGGRGIDAKDAAFLGTNDIHVFRGTNVVVFAFSRSKYLHEPRFSEAELSEVIERENEINLDRPEHFEPEGWTEYLKGRLRCVNPISVAFPISFLSLEGDDLKKAQPQIAELMVAPVEEDADRRRRVVRVNPIYTGRDFVMEPDLCFVLMEFASPYTEIYDKLIKATVEDEGFRCVKSDDIFSMTSVVEDIWENINKAALIIAEISSNNPNVMYELGVCHTVGKNVMMITQNPENVPFNFRHLRCYSYTNDIPGSEDLQKNIRSVIQHIKATQV